MVEIGVDSLRSKAAPRASTTLSCAAQVYRRAIDDAVAGRPFNPALITELEGLANQGYTPASWNAALPTTTRTTKPAVRIAAQPVRG